MPRAVLALVIACRVDPSQIGAPLVGKQYDCAFVDDRDVTNSTECMTHDQSQTLCDEWMAACAARHHDQQSGTWTCKADCYAVDHGRALCVVPKTAGAADTDDTDAGATD